VKQDYVGVGKRICASHGSELGPYGTEIRDVDEEHPLCWEIGFEHFCELLESGWKERELLRALRELEGGVRGES
jgi:hypothetical protein